MFPFIPKFLIIFNNLVLLTLSYAFLISRYTARKNFFFSTTILNLSVIIFSKNFPKLDKMHIGLNLDTISFFLFSFGIGIISPLFQSSGYSPLVNIQLKSFSIIFIIVFPPNFIIKGFMLSTPLAFLKLIWSNVILISSLLIGLFNLLFISSSRLHCTLELISLTLIPFIAH